MSQSYSKALGYVFGASYISQGYYGVFEPAYMRELNKLFSLCSLYYLVVDPLQNVFYSSSIHVVCISVDEKLAVMCCLLTVV
jgi:hypothetical protein